jgi:hypothetical protein
MICKTLLLAAAVMLTTGAPSSYAALSVSDATPMLKTDDGSEFMEAKRGRGRGGDDRGGNRRGGRVNSTDDNGSGSGRRKPRVPGGSGCDDAGDIAEHAACRG